jgi:hypothetical protein
MRGRDWNGKNHPKAGQKVNYSFNAKDNKEADRLFAMVMLIRFGFIPELISTETFQH